MVTDPTERAGIEANANQLLNHARSAIRSFEPKFQRRIAAGA
jgi:hypothetical protein